MRKGEIHGAQGLILCRFRQISPYLIQARLGYSEPWQNEQSCQTALMKARSDCTGTHPRSRYTQNQTFNRDKFQVMALEINDELRGVVSEVYQRAILHEVRGMRTGVYWEEKDWCSLK